MSRVFAYCRVSTIDQINENQVLEIKNAGFRVEDHRIIEEKISGSIQATKRPEFSKLLHKLERGDVLVVTKLDRLGRNAIDIRQTIELLVEIGVKVHCLAIGGMDVTSTVGKFITQTIAAFAELERDLIIERTKAGQQRAKSKGVKLGRKNKLTDAQRVELREKLKSDKVSVSELSRAFKVSRQTIYREIEVHEKSINQ